MKKTITGVLLSLVCLGAQAQETAVLQLFACNYHEGKNVENLWDLMETISSINSEPSPDEAGGSFVWLPFRSGFGFDYIYGIINSDLMSMASGAQRFVDSGNASVVRPKFAALGSCIGSVSTIETTKSGSIGSGGGDRVPDAMVETFRCSLKDGEELSDVRSLVKYWQDQTAKLNSSAFDTYDSSLMLPLRGGSGTWDWAWIGNWPDLATMAQSIHDYTSSKEGQAVEARLANVSRCNSALWTGYWVNTPTNRQ